MEVVPHRPIYVLVTNFTTKYITLFKKTLIARGTLVPDQLVEVLVEGQVLPGQVAGLNTINAVQLKKKAFVPGNKN